MYVKRRRGITAGEDPMIEDDVMIEDDIPAEDVEVEDVDVDPAASDLLFEAEDVAELLAEVTGEEISVTADDDAVVFEIGEEEYTVIPEGDEELVESSVKVARSKRRVAASRRPARKPVQASARTKKPMAKKPVAASRKPAGKTIVKSPKR